jgi:hypothetical protein
LSAEVRHGGDQRTARDPVIGHAVFDHTRGMQSRDLILSHDDIAHGFIFERISAAPALARRLGRQDCPELCRRLASHIA